MPEKKESIVEYEKPQGAFQWGRRALGGEFRINPLSRKNKIDKGRERTGEVSLHLEEAQN